MTPTIESMLARTPQTGCARPTMFRRVFGTGTLQYEHGTQVPCRFKLSAGGVEVSLRCDHVSQEHVAVETIGGRPGPISFRGESANGLTVSITGGMLLTDWRIAAQSDGESFLTYECTNALMEAAQTAGEQELAVSFALANIVFPAVETVHRAGGRGWRKGRTTFDIEGRTITLTQPDDYNARVNRLRANGGHVITAVAQATAADRSDLLALVLQVNLLGSVLTLATSNAVSWVSYTARNAATRRRVRTETRYPSRKPYGPLPLAPQQNPADFKRFVEVTFPAYVERETMYQLGRVAHARVDAVAGGFLEARGLLTCVLAEFLANVYTAQHGYASPVPRERFRNILPTLRERVTATLRELLPEADASTIDRMVGGVSRFNDAGLRDRLRFASAQLGAGISDDDIKAVLSTRRTLAHEMSFEGERTEYWTQYRRALHVADRILLRMLNYRGAYTNVETFSESMIGAVSAQ